MLFPITDTIFYTMDHSENRLNECAVYFFFFFLDTSLHASIMKHLS